MITIDGSRGEVILGAVPTVDPKLSGDFATLMGWADERRRLRVRANADTPADARTARRFGAEGIGLCRTEHMFFEEARIIAMREMILAGDADGRGARARQDPADAARRTSSSCSRSWAACRSRSDCSIRRCTSSCRTSPRRSRRSPRPPASMPAALERRAAELARSQPDARPARLPARRAVPRDLRDAGARDLRGGRLPPPGAPGARSSPRSWCRWSATRASWR